MLAQRSPALCTAAQEAAFVVADGITLVWASSWKGRKLPERVTGSDLIYGLSELSARRGYNIFLLGGAAGVADSAAARLTALYPGLRVVGTACPPHRPLTAREEADLIETIRAARPDLLFVALGQPKGEIWLHERYKELSVPVSVQVGASIDFAAARIRRAPRWIQRICMETPYRILQEPWRLAPRYFKNALFLVRMTIQDAWGGLRGLGGFRSPPGPLP
jgi:N-acetylglucosaminyldiphosphoundecaprenol N-acetyl-beta-D-mannosaminyltransferase